MVSSSTKVIKVSNLSPQANVLQMKTMFGYLGKIDDIRLYPTMRNGAAPLQPGVCYIKFLDSCSVPIAGYMSNTVFIDRALKVNPVHSGVIPDEEEAEG